MNNIPEELFKFLDSTGKHLSNEAISRYVKASGDLKDKEINFIEGHLSECGICYENFRILFDEDLDLDEAKYNSEINVDLATENHLNFIDQENNIDGIISKDEDIFYLKFVKLPAFLENRNARISFSSSNIIGRIVSPKLSYSYKLGSDKNLKPKDISKVYLDYIKRQNSVQLTSEYKSKVVRYKYWFAAVLVLILLIFLYIVFYPSNKIDKAKEEKKSISNSIVKLDSIEKEYLKPDSNAAAISESSEVKIAEKGSQSKPKILPEFRDNYSLEEMVNRSKKSGIIVSPGIGDTLKRQISFKWNPLQSENYFIVLLDNKNKEIWSKDLTDNRVTLLQKLDHGVYYWKLNSDTKLEAVGKFYVK